MMAMVHMWIWCNQLEHVASGLQCEGKTGQLNQQGSQNQTRICISITFHLFSPTNRFVLIAFFFIIILAKLDIEPQVPLQASRCTAGESREIVKILDEKDGL